MGENEQLFVRTQLIITDGLDRWLDAQVQAIKQTSGAAVSRSELVRAALRAACELDLARFNPRGEGDLAAILIATVRAGRQAMRW